MKLPTRIIALLICLAAPALAQRTYRAAEYFPFAVGDEWQYRNLTPDGLSPIVISVTAQTEFRGQPVFQRNENNGDWRYQSHAQGRGLLIHHLYFKGNRVIEYDAPVLLLPEVLRVSNSR